MKMENYDSREGKKVWLTEQQVEEFLGDADGTQQRIALGLGARCGLRVGEIVDVTPADVVETPAGARVRVWEGKGDKYRETPVPQSLASTIEAYADVRDAAADVPLVDKSTRTVERWVNRTAERRYAATSDVGWNNLGPHDLRRTWGTLLVEHDVEPGLVMEWGGWSDWDTFREHYLGAYSLDAERRQMEKVPWL
ncbi:tyrosine-type recombinase/integrase [Halostella salina]|uniref:tyrosine-type recombinase/integrase n=1 Tax=Halostella salina TaxID=1547897 RepID=UPI000EF812A1|nr:site-specific integrase [Halostella salina]